jgi:NAD(P)-dependent dehydrogenase (short-subunit alcohol dehydrogenase family)
MIKGCDSGFGNRLAMKLNEHGFRVYATVLDPSGSGSQNLITNARFKDKTKVLKMDVTNEEEINKTYEQIENDLNNNGEQLWAIVNNAGIASLGLIDWGTLETYKKVIDVNTFGTVRVTRTFLPLIKKSRGNQLIFKINWITI